MACIPAGNGTEEGGPAECSKDETYFVPTLYKVQINKPPALMLLEFIMPTNLTVPLCATAALLKRKCEIVCSCHGAHPQRVTFSTSGTPDQASSHLLIQTHFGLVHHLRIQELETQAQLASFPV